MLIIGHNILFTMRKGVIMKRKLFSLAVTGLFLFSLSNFTIAQEKKESCTCKSKTECSQSNKCENLCKGKCSTKNKCEYSKSSYDKSKDSKKKNKASCQATTRSAKAVVSPTAGNKVHGVVTFTKVKNGVRVVADIEGLTPGKHGFHIHQFGDCSDLKGKSAGGHFNPEAVAHAGHNSKKRHVGDFGNLTADASGNAHLDFVDDLISFYGAHNIIGRGIVIHGGADDLKSQPSGAAGPRVACGAIALSK